MIIDLNNPTDIEVFTKGVQGKVVGITSGCYDLLHHHYLYFQRCRRLCDILIVGVDSDDLVKTSKGPSRPIVPEHSRVVMIDALKIVHAVFIMGSLKDLERAVKEFGAQFIFKNQDFEKIDVIGKDFAKVIIVPDVPTVDSTTAIIEQIRASNDALMPQTPVKSTRKRNRN